MKRSVIKYALNCGLIAVLTAVVAACSERDDEHTLAVSIESQRYLLEQIAGDGWSVCSLMDRSSDPENFDPSMSALKAAVSARAYFALGQMPFEDELLRKILAGKSNVRIVDTSAGIELIEGHECDHDHHCHAGDDDCDHNGHDHAGEADPHIWSSVRNAKIMAANMRDAMIILDPGNQATYTANYNRLANRLDSLDNAIAARLDSCTNKSFLVLHPSLSYFARDYGLQQISLGSGSKELSVLDYRRRIDRARRSTGCVLFVDKAIDSQRATEIVREVSADSFKSLQLTSADWLEDLDRASKAITHHQSSIQK